VQSGKTLTCFIIPTLYHLFELRETVICGVPSMEMAADKWLKVLLPVIQVSRYASLLPSKGAGSRGGRVSAINFANGVTLRFMAGGGGDKQRAGYTARVLVVTETDGMDEASKVSSEADKLSQLEARTAAFGRSARIYMECTVTTEDGRTWSEYKQGTQSRIVRPCHHCGEWVTPERDNLIGWQSAQTVIAARSLARLACPACGAEWTDGQRRDANQRSQLLHRGQSIQRNGVITGDMPETDTLGFRWTAADNHLREIGDVAEREWRAARSPTPDIAERAVRQYEWTIPLETTVSGVTDLEPGEIVTRQTSTARGVVPKDSEALTIAMDLGQYMCHWVAISWRAGATGHVVDYGRIEVASVDFGVERALAVAIQELRDHCEQGWGGVKPDAVWIDSGWQPDVVYAACLEGGNYWAAKGFGAGQTRGAYWRPRQTGSTILEIGQDYHVARLSSPPIDLIEFDADAWKSFAHARLATSLREPGALTLFAAKPHEHLTFAHHLCAERAVEEYVDGKGFVRKMKRVNKSNHWLDATAMACAAAHRCGIRLLGEAPADIDGAAWAAPKQRKRR
jgi:hypothetical protein